MESILGVGVILPFTYEQFQNAFDIDHMSYATVMCIDITVSIVGMLLLQGNACPSGKSFTNNQHEPSARSP